VILEEHKNSRKITLAYLVFAKASSLMLMLEGLGFIGKQKCRTGSFKKKKCRTGWNLEWRERERAVTCLFKGPCVAMELPGRTKTNRGTRRRCRTQTRFMNKYSLAPTRNIYLEKTG
jgi:hypothetical protein